MRLDKFLCDMNMGTRNEVKEYIKKGRVRVNEQIIKKADTKVNEKIDEIYLDGVLLLFSKYQYYLLHKPAGYVTATKDNVHPTVMELLKDAVGKNLSPVGRLDKDTEGFLLITNDGELNHRLLSPKNHVPKTYYAKIEKTLSVIDIQQLEQGVDIGEDAITKPAKVEVLSDFQIQLTIVEGKFHQVKRMLHAVDNEVLYLKRIAMGGLQLPQDLPCGDFMVLTQNDIETLEKR